MGIAWSLCRLGVGLTLGALLRFVRKRDLTKLGSEGKSRGAGLAKIVI